jgi:hypothetical protein
VDAAVARVLIAFRDMLLSESEVVENFSLEAGTLDLVRPTGRCRLSVDEAELRPLIADSARAFPTPEFTVEQNAAALMLVHLDESLATREPHESGWWTYRFGFFHPLPPWEAHRLRRVERKDGR